MSLDSFSATSDGRSARTAIGEQFQPRLSRLGWALMFTLIVLVLPATANAQDYEGQVLKATPLKVIEIEETDEVRALRDGRAEHPYAAISARSAAPLALEAESRFLAAIDISRLDSSIVGGSDTARAAVMENAVATLEERTVYDAAGARATSFETRYDQINATLQCHWSYDVKISSRLAELNAKAREAELERSFEVETSGRATLPEYGIPEPPRDTDPEFSFVLKERQLKKAGRPCLLTVTCENESDPRCSEAFLDDLVKSVVLVREGAK